MMPAGHMTVKSLLSLPPSLPPSLTLLPLSHRESVEFLCNEGHIYSTVDDNHFKSTDQ